MRTSKLAIVLISMFSICDIAGAAESQAFAQKVIDVHGLRDESAARLRKLLTELPGLTRNIGTEDPDAIQGPNNSWHMASRQQCLDKVIRTGLIRPNPEFEKICGAPWMSPIPDAKGNWLKAEACMDQFEFPNIPCEYPVVWTSSIQAEKICSSMGKRVCNSHEWEGACSGRNLGLESYRFMIGPRAERRRAINRDREVIWAFQTLTDGPLQPQKTSGLCAVYSSDDPEISEPMRSNPSAFYTSAGKSLTCQNGKGSDFQTCGTNSWPAGFKHRCRSSLNVFDLHGNIAEVVNLPDKASELATHDGAKGGTERKGSFFVRRPDYPDDCRVRQPYEHFGAYRESSVGYYQEGFRCCKDTNL